MKKINIAAYVIAGIVVGFYLGNRHASKSITSETQAVMDSAPTSLNLDRGWRTGVQMDDFVGEIELYTAHGPENRRGSYIGMYCQPTNPRIGISLRFARTPRVESAVSWSSPYDDYMVRTRHQVLGIDTIGITQQSDRVFRVSIVNEDLFTRVSDSMSIELSRRDDGTETFYFMGIQDALEYLRSNCR